MTLFKEPETAEDMLAETLYYEGFAASSVFQTYNEDEIGTIRQMVLTVLVDLQFSRFIEFRVGLPWWHLFEQMRANPKTGKTDEVRVLDALVSLVDDGLVLEVTDEEDEVYVLVPEDKYQDAMDYVGVWYEGYEPPPGTEVLMLTEKGEEVLDDPTKTAELLTTITMEMECRQINALLVVDNPEE